jgi:ribosomal protein L37AE/L43A
VDYGHQCDYPGSYGCDRPVGSIWQCDGCGRYWYKYSMRGITWAGGIGRNWEKVRWYNWRKRALIKTIERMPKSSRERARHK